jgi:hypothetical protein
MALPPLQPDQPISVTLEAQQWNVVLGALGEAPYRIAAPVIGKIIEQVQPQSQQMTPVAKPNGADASHAGVEP